MATEPERPIENLLRAAAKKRRHEAGAPLELHPATRRLLQGEVARKFTKPGRAIRSFSEMLGQWWPRLAWGVAIFAVLGVAVWVLLPISGKGKPEALLARNESMHGARPTTEPLPPTPAPVAAATAPPAPAAEANPAAVAFADKAQAVPGKPALQLGVERQPVPPASVPAAPATPAPAAATAAAATVVAAEESARLTDRKDGQSALAYKSLAAAASANRPQSAPVATDGLSRSAALGQNKSKSFSAAQWFAQVPPTPEARETLTDNAAPLHPVLASFQVQQTGKELRIVDGDGSVYRGYMQIGEAPRRQRSANMEAPAAARASRALGAVLEENRAASLVADQSASQTYFFRVAGTNRSLNEKVVFTGNLLAPTNLTLSLPVATNLSIGGGLGGFQNAPAQQSLLPLLNYRISGKVVIGGGKAVEINALPTNP